MHVIGQAAVQHAQGAQVALVFLAVSIVAFWRILIRVFVALIAVAIIVAIGAGAIYLVHL